MKGHLPLVLALLCACDRLRDPCFTPGSVITDLRVLGVRADPPEVLVDLDAGVVPPVQVRALVAQGDGPSELAAVRARACVPADGGCPEEPSELTASTDRGGEAQLVFRATPELVRAARDADPLLGYGGIRVQLDLDARGAAGVSQARKMLLYTPQAPGAQPNRGLTITGVAFTYRGDVVGVAGAGGTASLQTGTPFGVRPLLAPGSIEEYDTTTLDGQKVRLTEHVSYNFYSTPHVLFGDTPPGQSPGVYAGLEGGDVADEPGPGDAQPPNGLVRVRGLKDSVQHAWIVARDGRGAVAWAEVQLNLSGGQALVELGCQ